MRAVIFSGLFVILTLSGCGPRGSPRLDALRPHLQAGIDRKELLAKSGVVPTPQEIARTLGRYYAEKKTVLLLDLDGTRRDQKMRLTFRNQRLVGAAIVKADKDGNTTSVDEVIVEEEEPKMP